MTVRKLSAEDAKELRRLKSDVAGAEAALNMAILLLPEQDRLRAARLAFKAKCRLVSPPESEVDEAFSEDFEYVVCRGNKEKA